VGSRRAAEAEAAWLRQRLTDKRALVRALQSDLGEIAEATERVSQMASIAREQNAGVRRAAAVDDGRAASYTPAHLAALDGVAVDHSEEGARALAQLAFLEEEFAATTDSLSLLLALTRQPRCPEPIETPKATTRAKAKPGKAGATPAIVASGITPAGWPVRGDVSSRFGWRESPVGRGTRRHSGLDIRAPYGTPVRASAGGVVVFAGRDSGGYGSTVVVDHGNDVKTLYGHLSGIYVRKGQRVPRGTVLGAVGNTGRTTGVHLHYEVRVGNVPVDPMLYVEEGGRVRQVAMVSKSRSR
jgi:murein DD-endopeptidase MepM/ murein hydrolase activator NlpD